MKNIGIILVRIALFLILLGLIFGHLASESYQIPEAKKGILGFLSLRPMHVSSAYLGIITAGLGFVSIIIQKRRDSSFGRKLQVLHLFLWVTALIGIFYSYFTGDFGGREYWEFNPIWALPIFLSFIVFLVFYLHQVGFKEKWPVYQWMWFTGIIFFIFTFIENYLWIIPYFRSHFIADMTIQWKVNGSLVGAVNQIIYGTAFYLMEKISGDKKTSYQKLTFALYFLGLFNLMFNWGHHIYLLPTEKFIHYIAYAVSMTEWILFIRIFYKWNQQIKENKQHYYLFPYRFLMAMDYWVILNLGTALLMSIPAINLYTHGTHITVAHAMGTTIGINTMIVLGASFYFIKPNFLSIKALRFNTVLFWTVQITLFSFLTALVGMGVQRALWQAGVTSKTFAQMTASSSNWTLAFIILGTLLMLVMGYFIIYLLFKSFRKDEVT